MVNKYINATYQEIIDLSTQPDRVTVIGIHTPSGAVPSKMLGGLYKQFKSVKYNGCDVVLRPTARQPIDPLHVGDSAGTQMDMRDLQNPILFRGCHGESLGSILNSFMASTPDNATDSVDLSALALTDLENFYYQCLTDMSWKKSMPENGFAYNGLHPLVYGMATNVQMARSGANGSFVYDGNTYDNVPGGTIFDKNESNGHYVFDSDKGVQVDSAGNMLVGSRDFFTNDLQPLGWFDTETRVGNNKDNLSPTTYIPKVFMGILLLSPSYTQGIKMYFRMVITHYFTFKDFRSISLDSDYSSTPGYYDTIEGNAKAVLTSARVR